MRVEGPYTVFWSTGDSTQQIATRNAGTYTARVRDVNGCVSAQAGSAFVELRPLPPAPTINLIGTYTLQAVSAQRMEQNFGGIEIPIHWRYNPLLLRLTEQVLYRSLIYSLLATLTCFSPPSIPFLFTLDANNKGLSIYPNPNPDKILTLETEVQPYKRPDNHL